jgi:hypothetical protein
MFSFSFNIHLITSLKWGLHRTLDLLLSPRWGQKIAIPGNSKHVFSVWLKTPCTVSEPYCNPFLEKIKCRRKRKKAINRGHLVLWQSTQASQTKVILNKTTDRLSLTTRQVFTRMVRNIIQLIYFLFYTKVLKIKIWIFTIITALSFYSQ